MRELADEEAAGSSPRGRGKLSVDPELGDRVGLIPAWAGKTEVAKCHGLKIQAHPRVGGENETSPDAQHRAGGSSPRGRGKLARTKRRCGRERLIPAWAGKTREFTDSPGVWGAHPRVGGENRNYPNYRPRSLGSSPRGRGKRRRLNGCPANRGLIPAWSGKTVGRRARFPRLWAHPRVGGENLCEHLQITSGAGSSPRGRGKPARAHSSVPSAGLIPAWAGKTHRCSDGDWTGRAHPRVGGENAGAVPTCGRSSGSSPRGRGKPGAVNWSYRSGRLIPAWAGKTGVGSSVSAGLAAHPRVGGENYRNGSRRRASSGSSPRGRGKLLVGRHAHQRGRLIPAWAGKTKRLPHGPRLEGAHPRVGGENTGPASGRASSKGSSPRGRGKRRGGGPCRRARGLIPAWAGKTLVVGGRACPPRAHPRVGGENSSCDRLVQPGSGSSPRGRGKPRRVRPSTCTGGLIPAWAGKTSLIVSPSSVLTAHPRVGGENTNPDAPVTPETGSSPRGRGKPERGRHNAAQEGLIPAWAGKTLSSVAATRSTAAHPRVGGENDTPLEIALLMPGSSPRGRGKRGRRQGLDHGLGLIPAWAGKTGEGVDVLSKTRAHPRVGGENSCPLSAA